MIFFWYLGAAIIGYLLGNINTAAIISRLKGFDIRNKGSGNAGASNALITMGKGAAACTTVVDMSKAFFPVFAILHWITKAKTIPCLAVFTGCMVILGHIFPFWMDFRGGKGFASLLGMSAALDWRLFVAFLVIVVFWLVTTKYIALATITCAAIFPVYRLIMTHSVCEFLMLLLLFAVIFWKHIPNLKRMKSGSELGIEDVKAMRNERE